MSSKSRMKKPLSKKEKESLAKTIELEGKKAQIEHEKKLKYFYSLLRLKGESFEEYKARVNKDNKFSTKELMKHFEQGYVVHSGNEPSKRVDGKIKQSKKARIKARKGVVKNV